MIQHSLRVNGVIGVHAAKLVVKWVPESSCIIVMYLVFISRGPGEETGVALVQWLFKKLTTKIVLMRQVTLHSQLSANCRNVQVISPGLLIHCEWTIWTSFKKYFGLRLSFDHWKGEMSGSIPSLGTPLLPEYVYSWHQECSLKRLWTIG